MAASKTYKPKVHAVLDIETLSTDKCAAIVEIGVVICLGTEPVAYSWKVKPSQYNDLIQFAKDPETVAWHEKTHAGYLGKMEEFGVTLQEALDQMHELLGSYSADHELHLWSQGKDFDFPILDYAFAELGMKSPWAYSRVHCLRDLVWLNPAARIKERSESLPVHEALSDALFEAAQLKAVVASSSWYQRLFK